MYSAFRAHNCAKEADAVRVLADKGFANFWELAKNYEEDGKSQ